MSMINNSLLKERLKYFRENGIFCHIITLSGLHFNGEILKQDDTHILLKDIRDTERLIAISDMKTLEESRIAGGEDRET